MPKNQCNTYFDTHKSSVVKRNISLGHRDRLSYIGDGTLPPKYLNEISKIPNLSAEDQIGFGRTIYKKNKAIECIVSPSFYMKCKLQDIKSQIEEKGYRYLADFRNDMSTKTPDEEVRAKGMEFEGLCQKIGPLYTERGRIINCGGELSRVKLVEEDIHREICSIGMWYRLASEVSSELKQTFSRWQNERDDSLAGHIEKSTGLRLEEIDYKLREISWLENSIDGAKNELVKSNLSLVASAASNDAVAFSLGVVGLMDSTVKYDYRKNIKFSYFATFRIKKEIGRGYWNCRRGIRLPANKTEYTLEVRKETEMLKEKLKREPTDMEVWESISKKTSQKVSFADFMLLRNIVSGAISLDEYYGNNRDNLKNNNLVEVIQPVHYGNLNSGYGLHDFSRCDAKKDAKKLLSCLNDHEREIMEMRFGIGGGEEKTLEGIGRVFGVTRERIRQIEASALGKIRKFINNA